MKILFGKSLDAMSAVLESKGLSLESEVASGFAGLSALSSGGDSVAALSEMSAKLAESEAALASAVEQAHASTSALESRIEELTADNAKLTADSLKDVLKADRLAVNIDNMATDRVDHLAVWRAMPSVSVSDRKARAQYFNDNLKNKIT